ncbi:MAG: NADPH-dependent 7-cyano-7-deazaguanine reductase QueF [Coxiellaceae bacterium]|nr:NADPH-dependent 7-cyano-7-deazaguanine reductase QueF [Coxiellaceae bacterium]
MSISNAPLGKKSAYIDHYDASLLFPIPRKIKRDEIAISQPLPFYGFDLWNAYEISWLNPKGKPVVALAEIIFPANSDNLIESKSLKLYLNSFNQTHFENAASVKTTIEKDLSSAVNAIVLVNLFSVDSPIEIGNLQGICLDDLDINVDTYSPTPSLLSTENSFVTEILHSHLLKSNCLVTFQPDWGSIQIDYTGKKINHGNLLRYLISFRQHNEFHEQCVERIFMDILKQCQPTELTVFAQYTRRGGLDINPYRSTKKDMSAKKIRLSRQ